MSCPCNLSREELTANHLVGDGGLCTARWADKSGNVCGDPLGAHPHQQQAGIADLISEGFRKLEENLKEKELSASTTSSPVKRKSGSKASKRDYDDLRFTEERFLFCLQLLDADIFGKDSIDSLGAELKLFHERVIENVEKEKALTHLNHKERADEVSLVQPLFRSVLNKCAVVLDSMIKSRFNDCSPDSQELLDTVSSDSNVFSSQNIIMGDRERKYSFLMSNEQCPLTGGVSDFIIYSALHQMVSLGMIESKNTKVCWYKEKSSSCNSSSSSSTVKEWSAEALGFIAQAGYQVKAEIGNIYERYAFKPNQYVCILTSGKSCVFVDARLIQGDIKLYHSQPFEFSTDTLPVILEMFKQLLSSCYGIFKALINSRVESVKRSVRSGIDDDEDNDDDNVNDDEPDEDCGGKGDQMERGNPTRTGIQTKSSSFSSGAGKRRKKTSDHQFVKLTLSNLRLLNQIKV